MKTKIGKRGTLLCVDKFDQLVARVDVHLLVKMCDVGAHGVLRQKQICGNRGSALSVKQLSEHFLFPGGQTVLCV